VGEPAAEAGGPVLVFGTGRSGTSWLGKLFDSHPDVFYSHEPDSIVKTDAFPLMPERASFDAHADAAADYLERILRARGAKAVTQTPYFRKSFRSPAAAAVYGALVAGLRVVSKATGAQLGAPDLADRARQGAPRLVVKSVNAAGRAALYARVRPDMRFVHILRHPGGVAASLKRGVEKGLMPRFIPLKMLFEAEGVDAYGLTIDEMERRSFAEQAAFRWLVYNDGAASAFEGNPACARVAYEALNRDLAAELRRLFDHVSLPWSEQTEDFLRVLAGLDGEAATSARYFSVMRPPGAGLDAWKSELGVEERAGVADLVSRARTSAVRDMEAYG